MSGPVAVQFDPIGKDSLDIVHRVRTGWVSAQEGLLPWSEAGEDLLEEDVGLTFELLDCSRQIGALRLFHVPQALDAFPELDDRPFEFEREVHVALLYRSTKKGA